MERRAPTCSGMKHEARTSLRGVLVLLNQHKRAEARYFEARRRIILELVAGGCNDVGGDLDAKVLAEDRPEGLLLRLEIDELRVE